MTEKELIEFGFEKDPKVNSYLLYLSDPFYRVKFLYVPNYDDHEVTIQRSLFGTGLNWDQHGLPTSVSKEQFIKMITTMKSRIRDSKIDTIIG